jgi:hypothetical protein
MGHSGHQCSHAPGRPILHRRLILSQTSAGSRFFRDAFGQEFYLRKLAKQGVKLVSITQPLGNDDDPAHSRRASANTARSRIGQHPVAHILGDEPPGLEAGER